MCSSQPPTFRAAHLIHDHHPKNEMSPSHYLESWRGSTTQNDCGKVFLMESRENIETGEGAESREEKERHKEREKETFRKGGKHYRNS